ncbi:hypothetical protein O1611_g2047 [Lasiodiplodia mahajangana]|uniref:Uncharacterized protein n=1 Tax=Lasiodiplodia mahajangana TaxID=1108764 RepID=A0ACC2JVZ3_9PEZI|nr:hypothetical protein O1611_g2047 [Lasiodiplodia mahajangana]
MSYETFPGEKVTDHMLSEFAELFSENYGVWGKESPSPGKRISLSARRLRAQLLPDGAASSFSRLIVDGGICVGYAFACRWSYNGVNVCWITQLVVRKDWRRRGVATKLVNAVREPTDDVFCIASSHPAACLAAARAFGTAIENVSLDFIVKSSNRIMKASPITYIRDAEPQGSIFNAQDSTGLVSGVDTKFLVDHDETLEVLNEVRKKRDWPLGELPEGHEYLLVSVTAHNTLDATAIVVHAVGTFLGVDRHVDNGGFNNPTLHGCSGEVFEADVVGRQSRVIARAVEAGEYYDKSFFELPAVRDRHASISSCSDGVIYGLRALGLY